MEYALILSIMSSIAQDELRKLSSRVKFGHQQAIKDSVVLGNSRIFGYKKDNKRLVIDEPQAEMVRQLFELYATDEYSMKQLERLFWEQGYRNLNGNKIAHSTMSNMISNPKYKGYYVGNKVRIVDMFTKKQKFLPPEEWIMFKDETGEIVPAIVSEELWEQANEVLRRRSEDVKNRQGVCNHANLFTGKIYCTNCGTAYYRKESKDKDGRKNSKWVCSGKINNGKESCGSFTIYESELIPVLFEVFRDTHDVSQEMLKEYENIYNTLTQNSTINSDLDRAQKKIEAALKKKKKLLELVTDGNISDLDFKEMTDQCNNEAEAARLEIADLQAQKESRDELCDHMKKIREVLEAAEKDVSNGVITKDFVDTFIDKIYVTPETENSMRIDIKIFTGESTTKYLERLRRRAKTSCTNDKECDLVTSCTGHTFKKMIEAYENGMK